MPLSGSLWANLTDTGPLVALIDTDETHYERCKHTLSQLPDVPLLTTWACLTEAMYILGNTVGQGARDDLWALIESGDLLIHEHSAEERQRMRVLMNLYADRPMDFADASLVAAAESLGMHRIFSIDSDFYIYQLADSSHLEVLPGPLSSKGR